MSVQSVFSSIDHISMPYSGVLLDAYGVFWGGGIGLLPGAKEAMARLVDAGKVVGILSNTTQTGQKEIEKLRAKGVFEGTHFHFIITSGDVAREVFSKEQLPFETPTKKYWLLGSEHPKFASHRALFEKSIYSETPHIKEADFAFISIPHVNGEDQEDPLAFKTHLENIPDLSLPLVCTNPDKFAHEGNPSRPVVRQGSLAKMYEEMGGTVFYVGKPSRLMFEKAMESFATHKLGLKNEILMVGDTPETDIRGAKAFGIASALIIKTGIFAERINENNLEAALTQLPDSDKPDYLIETLGE